MIIYDYDVLSPICSKLLYPYHTGQLKKPVCFPSCIIMFESQNSILPILDLKQPADPSFLSSLSQACQELGFFYVTNHGIPRSLFSKARSLSHDIFSLPTETKLKLGPSSSLKTYTPPFIASPYFESLRVTGPDFFASAKASTEELFGQEKPEYRY